MSLSHLAKLVASLLVAQILLARGEVYIISSPYHVEPISDLEADFGPAVPELGVEGLLKVADPLDACQPLNFTDFDVPWIALISRHQQVQSANCTFDIKVRHAEQAGAQAAIVYDDVFESLIIMSMPKGHAAPRIPAVFVTQRSGYMLTKLLEVEGGRLTVRIMPVSTVAWLAALMSSLLGLLAVAMVMVSFYVFRSWGLWLAGMPPEAMGLTLPILPPPLETGLPPSMLRSLPVVIYEKSGSHGISRSASQPLDTPRQQQQQQHPAGEPSPAGSYADEEMGSWRSGAEDDGTTSRDVGSRQAERLPSQARSSGSSEHSPQEPAGLHLHAGETKRICLICLEDYVEGDKIRVLPCLHRFHMQCVDQWFSSRRACPVCKHDAGQPMVAPPPVQRWPQRAGQGGHEHGLFSTETLAVLSSDLMTWLGLSRPNQTPADPANQPLLGHEAMGMPRRAIRRAHRAAVAHAVAGMLHGMREASAAGHGPAAAGAGREEERDLEAGPEPERQGEDGEAGGYIPPSADTSAAPEVVVGTAADHRRDTASSGAVERAGHEGSPSHPMQQQQQQQQQQHSAGVTHAPVLPPPPGTESGAVPAISSEISVDEVQAAGGLPLSPSAQAAPLMAAAFTRGRAGRPGRAARVLRTRR